MDFKIGDRVKLNEHCTDQRLIELERRNGHLVIADIFRCGMASSCNACDGWATRFVDDYLNDGNGYCQMGAQMRLTDYRPLKPKPFKTINHEV